MQTQRTTSQVLGDYVVYLWLMALWFVPGLVFVVATVMAGGAPHTRVFDWPYMAIRSVTQGHGAILPWEWVGATAVRSPIVFYGVVVLVTAAMLAVIAVAVVLLRGGLPAFHPFLSYRTARSRWAHRRRLGLSGLMVARPNGHRLALGRHRDRWVALREGMSVLALGAPASGKSAALCIPAIARWNGSVVAVSDQTDLIEATAGLRQHVGRVDILDGSGTTGLATVTWSSTAVHLTFDEAVALVSSVLGARESGLDEMTREVLTCTLYAAANRGVGVTGAVEWLDDVSGGTLVRSLLQLEDRDPRATSLATRLLELGRDERAASFSAARQLLRSHFEQAAPAAGNRAFQLGQFLSGDGNTLYVLTPPGPQLSGTAQSLLSRLVAEAEQRPRRRPVLLVLDGSAAVASMPGLPQLLAVGSETLTVVATVRDLGEGGHPEGDLRLLAERSRAVLLLGGASESAPAELMHELVSRQLGPRGGERFRLRRRPQERGGTEEVDWRPDLLPPDAARQLGQGRALLVHERMAPTVVWMRSSHEDPELQRLQRDNPYVRGVSRIHDAP